MIRFLKYESLFGLIDFKEDEKKIREKIYR